MEYYTEVLDLSYLLFHLPKDPFSDKMRGVSEGLIEVVENFNLVNFTVLDVSDKERMLNLVKLIDKATGYVYSQLPQGTSLIDSVFDFR